MFLLPSDFDNPPYKIPNQQESAGGISWLKRWIDEQERDLLKKLLGYSFYRDFNEGLITSGAVEQIWLDLKNGVDYTDEDGKDYEWVGMEKLLKPAVYSLFQNIPYRKNYNAGVVINAGQQNTTIVTPDYEVVTAWNEYVAMAGHSCKAKSTLYGFLFANEANYPTFDFCAPERKNTLDL